MKKALQLASVASMIDQFTMPNIRILQSLGYQVDVAANFTNPGTITIERAIELKKKLHDMQVRVFDIAIPRSLNLINIVLAYKNISDLLNSESYSLLHCHSPIGGVIARQAARRKRKDDLKVIYTAHGFHFYNGAPLKNWMIYYPIEKYYSRYTDVLITINNEDYKCAKKNFHANRIVKIPGVGVDTEKFAGCVIDRKVKRKELSLNEDDFVLLSVGELSERKNQKVVIDALNKMKENGKIGNIVYLMVGKGDLENEFKSLVTKVGLECHVKFLGFRTDIDELCKTVDCFVHPSIREGLGIAPLEAMAAGLPLISANVNGIKDYTENGVTGCCLDPLNVEDMIEAIEMMHDNKNFRDNCAMNNYNVAKKYDIRETNDIMLDIYSKL